MQYQRLFIFVEGPDDLRFFERIIKPRFEDAYDAVIVRPYAQTKYAKIDQFLRSVVAMKADYVIVADFDAAPCISSRKAQVRSRFTTALEDRITIVIQEIESWYLAGINAEAARKIGMAEPGTTNHVTKEDCLRLLPKNYTSRIDWMNELLHRYSIDTAKGKNSSFRRFTEKYSL